MRTHMMKITCNCNDCARFLKDEILGVDFCDLTHWYNGLTNEGEDTPDDCIIYQGELYPNVIYVECNLNAASLDVDSFKSFVHLGQYGTPDKQWNVEQIEVEELDHWKKIQKLETELSTIKASIENTITTRD